MISYGFSIQGKSHIQRGTVCQDYNKYVKLNSKWYLGIVADGVGSALHSDVGSKLATESLCEFCQKKINSNMSEQQLEDMLRQGYTYAMEEIVKYAKKENDVLDYYDTTLSTVLYDGENVIYGHAGDGGVIVKLYDGRIKPITERQKGADGSSVRPLRAGESSWAFGVYEEKVASVLLATDGMLDGVFQPVLINLPPDAVSMARGNFSKDNAYVTASEFFMNPNGVYLNKKIPNADQFMAKYISGNLGSEEQESFLKCMLENYVKMFGKNNAVEIGRKISKYYYAVWALKNVTDDKSVVCFMNEKAKIIPQDITYYHEPDWKWRQECYDALLYGKPMPSKSTEDSLSASKSFDVKTEIRDDLTLTNGAVGRTRSNSGSVKKIIISSVFSVLVVGVITMGILTFTKIIGSEDETSIANRPTHTPTEREKRTQEPTPTQTTTPTYENNDEIADKFMEDAISKNVKPFIEGLAKIDLSRQDSDNLKELKNHLCQYSLGDRLISTLSKYEDEDEDEESDDGNKNVPIGNLTPSPSEDDEGKDSAPTPGSVQNTPNSEKIIKKLIYNIVLIDSDTEINTFEEEFGKCFKDLAEDEQNTVRENLELILKYVPDRTRRESNDHRKKL